MTASISVSLSAALPVLIVGGVACYLLGIGLGILYLRSRIQRQRTSAARGEQGDSLSHPPIDPAAQSTAIAPRKRDDVGKQDGPPVSVGVALSINVVVGVAGVAGALIVGDTVVLAASSAVLAIGLLGVPITWLARHRAADQRDSPA